MRFSEHGIATATRAVPAADLNNARKLQDIGASELLVAYGVEFWRVHDSLGGRTKLEAVQVLPVDLHNHHTPVRRQTSPKSFALTA